MVYKIPVYVNGSAAGKLLHACLSERKNSKFPDRTKNLWWSSWIKNFNISSSDKAKEKLRVKVKYTGTQGRGRPTNKHLLKKSCLKKEPKNFLKLIKLHLYRSCVTCSCLPGECIVKRGVFRSRSNSGININGYILLVLEMGIVYYIRSWIWIEITVLVVAKAWVLSPLNHPVVSVDNRMWLVK